MTASNNTPDNSRSLNLHSTLDLIEAVPMFVGYRPADSLVALYGNAAGRLDRAARIELSLDPVNLAYTVNKLTQLCREHDGSQAQTLHLIAYSDDTDTADQVLLFIADNWGRDRTPTDPSTILATLASASTDHWAEINPNHPTAPTERTPYPTGTSELAADAVLAGIFQAYGTREELAATVTKPHPDDANVFAAQVDQATNNEDTITNPAGMAQWMADWITNGYPRINTHEAAQLTAAVQDIHVRDAAWCHITAADALHHVNLWRDIAARVDGTRARPVLGLLATAAWIAGDGTLAGITLERAATTEGAANYSLFGLVGQILAAGMPPTVWPGIRADLTAQLFEQ